MPPDHSKDPVNPILVIPARMASTRLPGKPLADIRGVPMIVRVWARAMAAGLGPVGRWQSLRREKSFRNLP